MASRNAPFSSCRRCIKVSICLLDARGKNRGRAAPGRRCELWIDRWKGMGEPRTFEAGVPRTHPEIEYARSYTGIFSFARVPRRNVSRFYQDVRTRETRPLWIVMVDFLCARGIWFEKLKRANASDVRGCMKSICVSSRFQQVKKILFLLCI